MSLAFSKLAIGENVDIANKLVATSTCWVIFPALSNFFSCTTIFLGELFEDKLLFYRKVQPHDIDRKATIFEAIQPIFVDSTSRQETTSGIC